MIGADTTNDSNTDWFWRMCPAYNQPCRDDGSFQVFASQVLGFMCTCWVLKQVKTSCHYRLSNCMKILNNHLYELSHQPKVISNVFNPYSLINWYLHFLCQSVER